MYVYYKNWGSFNLVLALAFIYLVYTSVYIEYPYPLHVVVCKALQRQHTLHTQVYEIPTVSPFYQPYKFLPTRPSPLSLTHLYDPLGPNIIVETRF